MATTSTKRRDEAIADAAGDSFDENGVGSAEPDPPEMDYWSEYRQAREALALRLGGQGTCISVVAMVDADNIDDLVHQSSRRVMTERTESDWMASARRSALLNLSRLVQCPSDTPASIDSERRDVEEDQSCSNSSGGSSRLHLPEEPGRKKALGGGDEDGTLDSTLSPVQTAVPSTAVADEAGLAASTSHSEESSYPEGSAYDDDDMSDYSFSPCNGKKMRAICCIGFVLIAAAVGVSVPLAMIRGPNKDENETTLSSTVGPEQPLEQSFGDFEDEGHSPQSPTGVTVDDDADNQSLILTPSPAGRTAILASSTSIQTASSAPTASPEVTAVVEPTHNSIPLEYMIDDTVAIDTSPDKVDQSSGTIGDKANDQHSQGTNSELPDYDQLTGPHHSTDNEALHDEETQQLSSQGTNAESTTDQYAEPRPSESEENPIDEESTGVASGDLDGISENETIEGGDGSSSVNARPDSDSPKSESFDDVGDTEVMEGTAPTFGDADEIFFMTPTGWQPILSPTSPQAAVKQVGVVSQTPPATFSRIPTSSPATSNPTKAPRTSRPTTQLASGSSTSSPTRKQSTSRPTPSPETARPTRKPRTPRPTPRPETLEPTRKPRTSQPTPSPETSKPTRRPTPQPTRPTKMPTNQPVVDIRPLPSFVGKSGNGNAIGHRLAIEIQTDKFGEETSWKVEYIGEENQSSKVVYSVKPETYQPHQRDFVELTLEPGKYKL